MVGLATVMRLENLIMDSEKMISFEEMDYKRLQDEYNTLINKIADLREKHLPIEWLDSKDPNALGEVVASPYSVLCYLDEYIEEFLK